MDYHEKAKLSKEELQELVEEVRDDVLMESEALAFAKDELDEDTKESFYEDAYLCLINQRITSKMIGEALFLKSRLNELVSCTYDELNVVMDYEEYILAR
jgi:hypothetical protein